MSADGTEFDLLTEIQNRLREKVPFSESQCFLCDAPVPMMFPVKDPCCTISVGASQFDPEYWSGGGFNQLTQHTPVLVTVLCRSTLDHPPRVETALLDPGRGLLMRYKPKILRALLANCDGDSSDSDGPMPPWSPKYQGEPILRDYVQPISCSAPVYMAQGEDAGRGGAYFLGITLTFRCSFDWRL